MWTPELTLVRASLRPGARSIHDIIVPSSSIRPYMSLELVELRQLGQHAQHKLQAALVTQHANYNKKRKVNHTGT